MSLPWFRVDNDFVDHPKVWALAAALEDPNAGWYVVRLWSWTSRYAARGRLADGARTALESACGWRGQPGRLLATLVQVGLLDETPEGLEVHDWWEHQGQAVEKAERDATRKRERRADGAETARGRRGDGAGTRRDETRRDETLVKKEPPPPTEVKTDPPVRLVPTPPRPGNRYASGEAYFAWIQNERVDAGFATEKPPRGLSAWFSEAMMEVNGDGPRLDAAVSAFANDDFWRAKNAPIAGFMSEWRKYVPRKAVRP